ncbi:MAG: DNA polymerase III subunit gamma/tau, partial [Pseudomonadota bacterium]
MGEQDEGQTGFELGGAGSAGNGGDGYVVLARKYRPETFDDLIGQDAMVTTLRNAFASDRIAQGYMLTGVRGVGKTTTARILARALNFEPVEANQPEGPTVDLKGYGAHCRAIIQSNHPDVLEMDAASNTGVDNIREIIEGARYRPLNARYKVYIIDEVHMLSKGAFNALLKTLEEPPPHVKFIFATTEIRKVPVTVLSRCQRFDLRRVEVPTLVDHFRKIAEAEGATAEEDALALIARAAEGSVRDGLSILDQAIAMGSGAVTADGVRAMIGLADRGRIFEVLDLVLSGRAPDALAAFDQLHRDGGDPVQMLSDLAETVHAITRAKVSGAEQAGDALSGAERSEAARFAKQTSLGSLSRAWQMLVRGLEEAGRAPDAKAAADMVLLRLTFTADLP